MRHITHTVEVFEALSLSPPLRSGAQPTKKTFVGNWVDEKWREEGGGGGGEDSTDHTTTHTPPITPPPHAVSDPLPVSNACVSLSPSSSVSSLSSTSPHTSRARVRVHTHTHTHTREPHSSRSLLASPRTPPSSVSILSSSSPHTSHARARAHTHTHSARSLLPPPRTGRISQKSARYSICHLKLLSN